MDDIYSIDVFATSANDIIGFFKDGFGFTVDHDVENGTTLLSSQRVLLKVYSGKNLDDYKMRYIKHHGSGFSRIVLSTNDINAYISNIEKHGYVVRREITKDHVIYHFTLVQGLDFGLIDSQVSVKQQNKMKSLRSFICNSKAIDHVALCIEKEQFPIVVNFFKECLGFHQFRSPEEVYSRRSAMDTVVLSNKRDTIVFTIVSPLVSPSPLEKFLNNMDAVGAIHHVAFLTDDIIKTVQFLQSHKVKFLDAPPQYYQRSELRQILPSHMLESFKKSGVLYDEDKNKKALLQIFSLPIFGKNSAFVEIIERRGNRGFGSKNIRALYTSLENSSDTLQNV